VQTWLPITLAEQVGAEAELGVSKSTIYCAVESGA
jgi:hypothetical protein